MKRNAFQLYLPGLLIAASLAAAGKHDREIADKLKDFDANLASRPELAVRACVQAIHLDPADPAAQGCMKKVTSGSVIDAAVAAAVTAQAGGRIQEAREWCDAALFADSTRSSAKCAAVGAAWVTHQQQLLTLAQARSKLQRKSLTEAKALLATVPANALPDVVNEVLALTRQVTLAELPANLQAGIQYVTLNQPDDALPKCKAALEANPGDATALQCLQDAASLKQKNDDQKSWSVIEAAKALNADGKHDAAVTNLTTLLGQTNLSPAVRTSAGQALAGARTTSLTVFRDGLKSQWIMQFLAASAILAGVWFGLHLARWVWRWILSLWAGVSRIRWLLKRSKDDKSAWHRLAVRLLDKVGKLQWAFTGVQDDGKIGANDAVLDALRRVPNEVSQAIWTPGRLILHAVDQGFEVWEDFGSTPPEKQFHEEIFRLLLNQGRAADNALADAFQNLQFNVGGVGLNVVARFWRAIMDWWRDGQPGFSGTAQEAPTVDGLGKQVVIRLTCSGGPYGTVSALAATRREDNVDAVALTAARAAYKLLSRMTGTPETVEQIDGHASFRQGAKTLSCYVRSVADAQTDQTRLADLSKAVVNLEFARQVFCRDKDHASYYLEALRFEAIGYALTGHPAAALTRFEELEDEASRRTDDRGKSLALEAAFNQGVLHMAAAAAGNFPAGIQLAADLFSFVKGAAGVDDPLAIAAEVRRVDLLAAISREAWPQLQQANCDAAIVSAEKLIRKLADRASSATGDERRALSVLATEARRNLAIARIRHIGAFDGSTAERFETSPPAPLDTKTTAPQVEQCLAWFEESDAFGSASVNALVCRAYALLLAGDKWSAAEFYARQALALDKTCQFAYYVAGEACYQRGDKAGARQYLAAYAPNPITDSALSRLNRRLNPPSADAPAAAG